MPTSGGQRRPDIHRAIARRGKLLIAEGVYPPRIDQSDIGRGAAANDVNMLVCTGGRQRSGRVPLASSQRGVQAYKDNSDSGASQRDQSRTSLNNDMAHPRMYDDSNAAIKRLREVCLALPDAFEKEAWGECTFRVTGGSMFAMTDNNHHNSGHVAVWVKVPPMVQEILVKSDSKRFFVPPYMGPKGWIGVRLDHKVNWMRSPEC